jgi:lipoprotein-anchoring transpeptidase ErfK/SrfK
MAWDENANACQSGSEAVTSNQPLTREECGKAGMKWSDDANVCGEANQAVSEVTTPSQPLTRADCDKAGMTWKDNANVCSESEASSVAGAPPGSSTATNKPVLAIVINIDKTRQRMRVLLNGVEKYEWPASTGRPSYFNPVRKLHGHFDE